MKRSPFYALEEIGGRFFLYPFGRKAAEFARDVEINEVGSFLWDYLKEEHDMEDIVSACIREYECGPEEYDNVRNSIKQFIDDMILKGLITEAAVEMVDTLAGVESSINVKGETSSLKRKYEIAGIVMTIIGGDEIAFREMERYKCATSENKEEILINLEGTEDRELAERKRIRQTDGFLIRNKELSLYKTNSGYEVAYDICIFISRMTVNQDGSICNIEYIKGEERAVSEALFNAIRLPFFLYAQSKSMVALHSASIVYKNRGWLFTGQTGSGKSTQAYLWRRYVGTDFFNGDVNLLKEEDSLIYMYGLPWCGSSGLCDPGKYPVGGIVFVNKSDTNKVCELNYGDKVIRLLRRLFSPNWCENQIDINTKVCKNIANVVVVCELMCTKDENAIEVMKEYIDSISVNQKD